MCVAKSFRNEFSERITWFCVLEVELTIESYEQTALDGCDLNLFDCIYTSDKETRVYKNVE